MGTPVNSSQCYLEFQRDKTANYTLGLHKSIFIAVGGDIRDSSWPFVSIFVEKGLLDIYVSQNSSAIQYVQTNSGQRQIIVSERHQVSHYYTSIRRTVNKSFRIINK